MKILVTGGCGFLGHHVIEHLLKNTDTEIVVLDRLSYASSGFDRLRDIGQYPSSRIHMLGCDLAQPIPEGIDREIGTVDYVIHTAAETHVDNSIVDPLPFLTSNVLGTHHLLWWLRARMDRRDGRVAPRRLLLVSTDEVYGPAGWDEPGANEQATYRPANPYAASKAGAEMLAWSYANTYDLPIMIVNTMNLIGERQGAEKMVPMCIRKVLAGETVTIHADPTRTRPGQRYYLHCRNYADAILTLLRMDAREDWSVPGVRRQAEKFHVAGEREISNLDLAQMIADIVGKPLDYNLVDFHASRPGHDLRYAMDDSKIRAMGWKQPVTVERSLQKTVEWFLANPKWLTMGMK